MVNQSFTWAFRRSALRRPDRLRYRRGGELRASFSATATQDQASLHRLLLLRGSKQV